MVSYDLGIEGREGTVELAQKPETTAPTIGQVIEGDIEDSKHGPKLKKAKPNPGGSGYSGKPDKNQDSIENQVALKVAGEIVSAGIIPGQIDHHAGTVGELLGCLARVGQAFLQSSAGGQTSPVLSTNGDSNPSPPPAEPSFQESVEISADALRAAAKAYIEKAGAQGGLERQEARKRIELKMAAIGLEEGAPEASPEQRREMMSFLTA